MVEVKWRRDEFVVFFKGVIESIIKSKFNLDKYVDGNFVKTELCFRKHSAIISMSKRRP
jgi:hypothetical protein